MLAQIQEIKTKWLNIEYAHLIIMQLGGVKTTRK